MNNWIDYGLFWLYIYIHERFSLAYLIPIPMFSLFSWFLYCSTCSKSMKSMKPNGNIRTKWVEVLSFVKEKELFHRGLLCFFLNNLFWKRFSNFLSNRLNNATMCEALMPKKSLNSWKRQFLVWQFKENKVFIISVLSFMF